MYLVVVKKKRIIKLFIIFSPFFAIYWLFNLAGLLLRSKNDILISRSCICQSENIDIRNAFFKNGSHSNNFNCPMTIRTMGRLGNNMCQYATLLALARLNGYVPYQQELMKNELKKYFNQSMRVVSNEVHKKINWNWELLHDWMSAEYSIFHCNFTLVHGFPCSWTFYHHIRDDIKREFQFHREIIRDVEKHLGSLSKSAKTTFIGVHVRREDYVTLMKDTYEGVLANSEFFTQAMNYYRGKFKDCLFIVCSDDLNWCKKNIDNSLGDVHFCWGGNTSSPGRDMALLTQCNHSIITVGTFSFWSAYLTGGEVVYLNNYVSNTSVFRERFLFNATYLPEWIPIEADLNFSQTKQKY